MRGRSVWGHINHRAPSSVSGRFLGHLFVRSIVLPSPKSAEEEGQGADTGEQLLRWIAARDAEQTAAEAKLAADRAAGLDPGLRVLYVLEPGRVLSLRNQAFTVVQQGLAAGQTRSAAGRNRSRSLPGGSTGSRSARSVPPMTQRCVRRSRPTRSSTSSMVTARPSVSCRHRRPSMRRCIWRRRAPSWRRSHVSIWRAGSSTAGCATSGRSCIGSTGGIRVLR